MTRRRARPLRTGLALVGVLLIGANLRAGITVVGPLIGEVRADLGLSSVAASALIGLPLLCFALFSPFAPGLARAIGLERTIGAALFLLAAAILLRSMPWSPGLWTGTVLLGFALAHMNVLLPVLIKRDSPRDTGRATGAYSATQSAFAAIASSIAVPVAGLTDWTWRFSFGVFAGLAIIAFAVFLPQMLSARGHGSGAGEQPAESPPAPEFRSPWKSGLAWTITISMAVQSALFYCVITWWPAIEQANGVSAEAAGAHLGILQFCGIAGNLIVASIIQRRAGDQRALVVVLVGMNAAGLGGMLLLPGLAIVWSAILGLSMGGMIVFALAVFGLRTTHHRQAAALSGMAQSIGYLLAAFGPLAIGAVHDETGGWTIPLLILLGMQAVQLLTAWRAARPVVLA